MYVIKYYCGNQLKETIGPPMPLPVARWKKKELKATTHKMGILVVRKA